jgi:Flp pilus assembly protein TadB
MVPVKYSYVTWDPPYLSEEEELALGRQIAAQGREQFVAEFRKRMWKRKGQPKSQPASPLKIFFAILFFIACISFIVAVGKGPLLVFLLVMVLGIYFVSMHFATRKFEKWVDRLVAKYAAHVAKGSQ